MSLIATTVGHGPWQPALLLNGRQFHARVDYDDEAQAYAAASNVRRDIMRGHRVGWRPWTFHPCECNECQELRREMAAG